ncbi:MAG: DNA mismatch repair protein MutS, partial [Bdellovibrionales bacterium]|nr:DNA mismatch repair protein MutS [Bdellovibrionales bacterium]
MGNKLTPLMQQYWDIKSAHEDKILLFRMGDFFEMFHQDAETAAPILNIALTQRNKKSEDNTPMCGVPHHSIAGPIAKLLNAGYKVAICDQIEDPKEAKGIVKRAVTRILSPGMVYDPEELEKTQAHYLCAFSPQQVSFLDTTTGEAFYYKINKKSELEKLIEILAPKELILSPQQKQQLNFANNNWLHITVFEDLK